ncbi:hypothetical protein MKX50_03685 [Paenibacillus sp. FSL W8-0186]|uniref:hypothetical protein n=1 Tax=Paenibacillus TaxID=44249 RepID=UPI0030CC04D3
MKDSFIKLVKELDHDIIPGLSSEIRDCLNYNDKVLDCKVDISEDKVYCVSVRMHDYTLPNIKSVFSSLVQFIQYTSTFYVRNDTEHNTEYLLLSQSKGNLTFYCKIVFRP